MRMRTVEISVGTFVLAGIIALVFLAVRVSGVNLSGDRSTYDVLARFGDVSGLRERAKVTMAGVAIGTVTAISVDLEYGEAIVTMTLSGSPGHLPVDTGAKILTEGILGTRYVSLLPGADTEMLGNGDYIENTQGALVLENLVGDLITRLGQK